MKDVRGEVKEGDRAESVELVHVREMVKMQVSPVVQMELLHTVKTVSDTIGCDGRYATVALNGGPLAALLLAWSSISRKSLLNTKEEMSCSRIVSTFSAWCVMTNDM